MKLRFVLLLLLVAIACAPLAAQTVTVAYQQRVEIRVPGATAAYSLNSFYADASVVDGVVVEPSPMGASQNWIAACLCHLLTTIARTIRHQATRCAWGTA